VSAKEVGEPAEAICESKLRKYGFILTYGSTAGNVKVAGANEYPVGVALQSTKKYNGTVTSSVRIPFAKDGKVRVFCKGIPLSIPIGGAIKADASGCGILLPKLNFATASLGVAALRSLVGISDEKLASNVSGYVKVYLKLHSVPQP
jgi:hypothetical protein